MHKLGISIYPDRSSIEKDKEYLDLASKYGFKRIFTNLLSIGEEGEEFCQDFRTRIRYANKLDMELIADVSPAVFKALNIGYDELGIFKDLGFSGIRLDLGFSGMEEAAMSYNPYDSKIEINISSGTRYIENIMSYRPNVENLIGCHNFYPHSYTGLSREHFLETTELFKKQGIRTAAFVSSANGSFGPWPVNEGLPTLEEIFLLGHIKPWQRFKLVL